MVVYLKKQIFPFHVMLHGAQRKSIHLRKSSLFSTHWTDNNSIVYHLNFGMWAIKCAIKRFATKIATMKKINFSEFHPILAARI